MLGASFRSLKRIKVTTRMFSEELVASASRKPVLVWLAGSTTLVAGMVAVGGLTRLTRSGLSMTSWKFFGTLPPMNKDEWEAEFDRYKQYPEFKQRKNMTLDEFKSIFWWEYSHRMLGRLTGLVFTLPLLYFVVRKQLPKPLLKRGLALLGLGGLQGFVGWWMVRSGLGEDRREDSHEIRVTPIRLMSHLAMALASLSLLVETSLVATSDSFNKHVEKVLPRLPKLTPEIIAKLKRVKSISHISLPLIFITLLSGSLVAGNDAGMAYNTFPKMMYDQWLPDTMYTLTPFYKNIIQETEAVQFHHRVLATLSLLSVTASTAMALPLLPMLPPQVKMAIGVQAAALVAQYLLGITTLVHYCPIPLSSAHQICGMLVLGSSVYQFKRIAQFIRLLR